MSQNYDHRALLREIRSSYVSPVADMPESEIEAYIERQETEHVALTKENFPGQELTPDQFESAIRLQVDQEIARQRGAR